MNSAQREGGTIAVPLLLLVRSRWQVQYVASLETDLSGSCRHIQNSVVFFRSSLPIFFSSQGNNMWISNADCPLILGWQYVLRRLSSQMGITTTAGWLSRPPSSPFQGLPRKLGVAKTGRAAAKFLP
jgi:hypothetical protein